MPSVKEIVRMFAREGILIAPDVAQKLTALDESTLNKILLYAKKNSISVISLKTLKIEELQISLQLQKVEDKKVVKKVSVERKVKVSKTLKLTDFLKGKVEKKQTVSVKTSVKAETTSSTKAQTGKVVSLLQLVKQKVSVEKPSIEEKPKVEVVEQKVEKKVEINYTSPRYKVEEVEASVEILKEITAKGKKWKAPDFVNYYKSKLEFYKRLLKSRIHPISIKRIRELNPEQEVGLIGRVFDLIKREDYAIITLEDTTSFVTVKVFKDTPAWEQVPYLVPDDVIGVKGIVGKSYDVIAKEIVFPDIPSIPLKKAPDEVYALFITDIHVGSKYFLEEPFKKFLNWLNLKVDRQREIAKKVKYLIITGDIVDGVGIYPEQEKELVITDIGQQYEYFANLIMENLNRDDIKVIIIPGNHDAVRLEEPQPPLPKDIAKSLYQFGYYILPNPSWVRIHRKENFEGFNLLLYHGYVFDWLVSNVEVLREGYLKPDIVMKYLLIKRQLFGGHGSVPYVPQVPDPLVIDIIPDIFATGHVHKTGIGDYKGVTLLNAGCWQETTPFQKKIGHVPDPGKAIAINLKTREKLTLTFYAKNS